MKAAYIIYILCLIFFLPEISYGQQKNIKSQLSSMSKRADKLFEQHAYIQAGDMYRRIVEKNPDNIKAKVKLAESLRMQNNTIESEYWFSEVYKSKHSTDAIYKLHYAEVLLSNGKNEEASKWYDEYSKENANDVAIISKRKSLENFKEFYQDSLVYTISEVSINSEASDFCPAFYKNGIVYVSSRNKESIIKKINVTDQSSFLNVYYSDFIGDTGFSTPGLLNNFSNYLHDGPVTFFDKDTKVIFSSNSKSSLKKDGKTSLALYYSELTKDGVNWTSPRSLPFNNSGYSLSHPCFDENTSTLYFSSDMPNGYGATDIYKVELKDGEWMKPENMGPQINTFGNEMFPFVSKDSCLYFSSNGLPGMGGLDIFRTDLKQLNLNSGNMGYPLNTSKDDFSLIITDKGSIGYFSSNRKTGSLNDDIYRVEFHSIRLEVTVQSILKAIPIRDAMVKIVEMESGDVVNNLKTNIAGGFSCSIKPGKHYELEIVKEGFLVNKSEVYSSSKDQRVLRKVIVLDKHHKSFVSGKVKNNGKLLTDCKVSIIDFDVDSVETHYTDSLGQFQCEINTDTINIFYLEKDNLNGIWKMNPVKKKRQGSGMTFITVELGQILTKKLTGVYLDTMGLPVMNDSLYLKNELNGTETFVTTGQDGKFTINVWLDGKYTLLYKENSNDIYLASFFPESVSFLELRKKVLVEENEIKREGE